MTTLRIATPVSLGRLMTADMIRAEFFGHLPRVPSVRWVAAQLPLAKRQRVGKGYAWWESDVRDALTTRAAA
jgi:hypothetical protein